jgi:DNA invertase Pin-like site-specific DNA recombinase
VEEGRVAERFRCAIYTRKSSEEGLEQGFNSLHAQREACEAYISSQRHEGWTAITDCYDDGGISGGTLDRPGLQRLLADIEAKRVQVIVVYKVDRLTRSLADFAKLVERFDAHGVSFVSVTQQFNTTTSMGRLTLNVLLSFAQFEREVTGERIRDKIAASKKKGMWMGGMPPIGYVAKDRTLEPDAPQAQRVQEIYKLYLELDGVRRLKQELDQRGWATPQRMTTRAGASGGRSFSRGHLYRILSNPIYVGQIKHKDQVFPGNHPPIIDLDLWQAVQDRLQANLQGSRARTHASHPSLLAGKLFDAQGHRLTPSHAQKGTRRYRYYVGPGDGEQAFRVPAHAMEQAVINALIGWLGDEAQLLAVIPGYDLRAMRQCLSLARALADQIKATPRARLDDCVARITVTPDRIAIKVRLKALAVEENESASNEEPTAQIEVPMELKRCGMATRLIVNAGSLSVNMPDAKLVALLAKAQDWFDRLTSGRCNSILSIARQEQVSSSYVTRVIKLAFLAPDIVQRIARGEHPPQFNADRLIRMVPLPDEWEAQRILLGFG